MDPAVKPRDDKLKRGMTQQRKDLQMEHMSMLELNDKRLQLGPDELILDVRAPDEYQKAHVPGSKNIPHDQVQLHLEELKKYKKIYVHCQAGGRAGKAAEILARLGLSNLVCVSGGGMGDWVRAGLPVDSAG